MDYEPMTLGSPVQSPSHIYPVMHQGTHGSQFLPAYLMGDISSPNTPASARTKSVCGKVPHSVSFGGTATRSPPSIHKISVQNPRFTGFNSPSLNVKEKVSTPPVHTLMDDMNQTDVSYTQGLTDLPMRAISPHDRSILNYMTPTHTSGFTAHRSPPSPGQTDPFYTQGELITPDTQLDDTWVTVFGFSSTSASFVIQRFSQYGNIVSHHMASNGGNWMHIHYETSLQAHKALSRNGKIFPGNIMIGVVPCIDVKLMSNPLLQNTNNSVFQSPAQAPVGSRTGTPLRPQKPPTLRPLTAAYNAAASDQRVASETRTPQKTNGIITKAIDYLFG